MEGTPRGVHIEYDMLQSGRDTVVWSKNCQSTPHLIFITSILTQWSQSHTYLKSDICTLTHQDAYFIDFSTNFQYIFSQFFYFNRRKIIVLSKFKFKISLTSICFTSIIGCSPHCCFFNAYF